MLSVQEYIKMEQEYRLRETVLDKLGRGLELEAANMDRDIESDYKTLYNTELDKVTFQTLPPQCDQKDKLIFLCRKVYRREILWLIPGTNSWSI